MPEDADSPAETWVTVATLADLPRGGACRVMVEGYRVALFHLEDGELRAIGDDCPHRGYPLHQGDVYEHHVTCPLHHWVFSLDDGACCFGSRDARSFPVRVQDGEVQIASPRGDPRERERLRRRLSTAIAGGQLTALPVMAEQAQDLGLHDAELLQLAADRSPPELQGAQEALRAILDRFPALPPREVVLAGLRLAAAPPRQPCPRGAPPPHADPGRFAGEDGEHLRRRVAAALELGRPQDACDAAATYLEGGAPPAELASDLLRVALHRHPALLPEALQVATDAYRWREECRDLLYRLLTSLADPETRI